MNVVAVITLIFAATFIIESSVEYFIGTPMSKIPKLQPYTWTLIYVSAIFSILISFFFQFDLIALISESLETPMAKSWVGIVLTGLVIARGSNFLHQFVSKFFPAKS